MLWTNRISECRNSGQTVKTWCKESGIREPTYCKWQKRVFELAKAQQEMSFVDVIPARSEHSSRIAVTVYIAGMEAEIHSGADATTMEAMLRILKSCYAISQERTRFT